MKITCPCCNHEFIRTETFGINESPEAVYQVQNAALKLFKHKSGEYFEASRLVDLVLKNMTEKVSPRNVSRILKEKNIIHFAESKRINGKTKRVYQIV